MPFFQLPQQHQALSPEATLYQLLSSLSTDPSSSSQPKQCQPQSCRRTPTFTPAFDVTETETAYELYGELPGLEQKDVEIEFTDAQTIVIKGKVERGLPQSQIPAQAKEEVKDVEKDGEKQAEKDTEKGVEKQAHATTVEDEYDEADTPLSTPASTSTTTATVNHEKEQVKENAPVPQAPKAKFWVSERKVGSFARSFSFAQRIEHDGVQAGLKNGILRVVVPKSRKSGKVAVSVF